MGSFTGLSDLVVNCSSDHVHKDVRSKSVAEDPVFLSGKLWPETARRIAEVYGPLKDFKTLKDTSHLAGLMQSGADGSFGTVLTDSGFQPASRRAVSTVANRIASCVQPSKRVAPMLVPEGLGPTAHLSVALSLQHPFLRSAPLSSLEECSLAGQHSNPVELIAFRRKASSLLKDLAAALREEWEFWIPFVNEKIRPINERRHVPFCRELSFCTSFGDICLWPSYVHGLPMSGWADPSLVLPTKITAPSCDEGE